MKFSAWKIWLHPRVSRQAFEELSAAAGECASMRIELAAAQATVTELRAELAAVITDLESERERRGQLDAELGRLSAVNGELECEKIKLGHSVAGLQRKLDEANAELGRRIDADTQIAAFEAKLKGFGEVKERYEQRIRRLRNEVRRLRDAGAAESADSSEMREIDMTGSLPGPGPAGSDWLEDLPAEGG